MVQRKKSDLPPGKTLDMFDSQRPSSAVSETWLWDFRFSSARWSRDVLQGGAGGLSIPALYRLEGKKDGYSPSGARPITIARRKFYSLTPSGRKTARR